jgi:hypothetical protein
MTPTQIYNAFHDEVNGASTLEIRSLHDLCHDGVFCREAGVEFILAVETVCEERGIDEGS